MIDVPATNTNAPLNYSDVSAEIGKPIGAHWKIFLGEGTVLILLGILAILSPFFAGLATTLFIGWLLLLAGVSGLIFSYQSRATPGFWWGILSSTLALFVGVSLLWNPVGGLFTLTLLLIGYFLADGVLTIILGLNHRREHTDRWQWIVGSGVIDLFLAAILISGLPGTAFWGFGLLVGVDLAFAGVSIVAVAMAGRMAAA
ncbi:HdeD family acid-resistance protein [Methylocapsa palsarum]|uniref:Uncharacterized membrane protein HdeD, DUF308 family n=1 Tax=Methylocapsa palsarum TaxID=1612308 RepID=A0A1I4B8V0_9HYPH|nr:DUF308 domain-containing protein [Methylocapsa palsarum]SFK64411.1 Uncharacterized membrane protein HdeD, DUF308 family [Methylocapsa palsarum]